jgi:hypothetical protein
VATTGFAAAPSAEGFAWSTFAPNGLQVNPMRIGRVHTEDGVEVLHLSAVTTLSVRNEGLYVDNMVEGSANLPSCCSVVSASETLLPGTPSRGVGVAQFELEADGQLLTGVTTSPYQFTNDSMLPSVLVRHLSFAGSSRTETGARIEVQSTWESLIAAGALHG